MKSLKHILYWGMVLFLFPIFSAMVMNTSQLFEESNNAARTVIAILLSFIVALLYKITFKEKYSNPFSKIFMSFILSSYLLSFFWSIARTPFGSNVFYISLLLPYLIYAVSCMYNSSFLPRYDFVYIFYFMVLCLLYYQSYSILEIYFTSKDRLANSGAYVVICLLPIILLSKSNLIKGISILASVVIVIMSYKRGGVFALAAGIVAYFYIGYFYRQKRIGKLYVGITLLLVLVGTIFYVFDFLGDVGSDYLLERMESISDDQGSSRTQIWLKTIDMISNSSFPELFLGHGFNMVETDSPYHIMAHNDLLEIAYDYGIPIMIIVILMISRLILLCLRMANDKSQYAAPLAFSIAELLVLSMISKVIPDPSFLTLEAFVWGILIGRYQFECRSLMKKKLLADET